LEHRLPKYTILWSVQELRRLSLLDTNITPIQNNKTPAANSFTFNPVQYTPLVIRGTDKNKQLTVIKPTQTGINRNKYTFSILKSLEPSKKFKNQRRPLVK
jgi:hypothetical protein